MAEGNLCDSNLALKLRFGAVASFDFGADNLGVLTEGLALLCDDLPSQVPEVCTRSVVTC